MFDSRSSFLILIKTDPQKPHKNILWYYSGCPPLPRTVANQALDRGTTKIFHMIKPSYQPPNTSLLNISLATGDPSVGGQASMAREDPVPEAMTKILSKLSKNVSSSWLKLLEHGDEIDCDIWIILNKRCKWKVKLDKSWISCKLIIHVYIHTYIFMYIYIYAYAYTFWMITTFLMRIGILAEKKAPRFSQFS